MNEIINYYNQFDEWGRLDREPIEFQVNWHFIKRYLPNAGTVLDNGAGPGKYAMELAKSGHRVTLTDLTPKLVELAKAKAKELKPEDRFDVFYTADARSLQPLGDETFDCALMLGPLYHLQEESDRLKAVQELNRVTKKKGIVFVAFMSRVRHILTSLQAPENWKPHHHLATIQEFSQTGRFDHADAGRFTGAFYYNIEEIKPFMESNGFETVELIGSNVGASLSKESWTYWQDKGEEQALIELLKEKATDPHLLGISSHLMYIGRKL
ncbi:class I SAM-dependent methyltransferase [Alkalihalobacillus pseudalcaliphilus]|uniref:class I SAM-dependent methyltransferase n=1 Tax=Alkalihalobacillus pseudalcaliphilus TaxID=79884 RepID=UPI00064DBAB7|nr:class I SAM-dependent methyltransferase [Alkalihalobacillus pseudalcaliphilus]KMK74966.1 methyltransferase [Alkalihalobacillus pseudalcaliphilus]